MQTPRMIRILCVAALALATAARAKADDPELLSADRALMAAAFASNHTAVTALLHADATWTDAQGHTLTAAELSTRVPRLAMESETNAAVRRFEYERVGVVQVDRDTLHTLRVWVRRPEGWRLLVYQEVKSLDTPPRTTPGTGDGCDNPCKRVPYQPRSANERDVIAAYQGLETAAVSADAERWGQFVADEFILVSSNGDRTFDKPTRQAAVGRSSYGGVSPTELLSATLFDFGTTVVMRARHRPHQGHDLEIARVWVKRSGRWMSTLSYQTAIVP
ncbi:MAG: nuclear transport factor 2 family protein [Vicinamibacterales bacterium]